MWCLPAGRRTGSAEPAHTCHPHIPAPPPQLQEAPAAPDAKEDFLKKVRTVYDIIGNPEIENDTKGVFIRSIVEEIIYDKEKDALTFRLYSPQKPA